MLRNFILFFALTFAVAGAPKPEAEILDQYVAASEAQKGALNGSGMEVDILAAVPRMRTQGRLLAFRRISEIGRVTYEALRFEGDRSIRSDVIARYLKAETQAGDGQGAALAVTPANYRFRYKGMREWLGRNVHVFEVKPRRKRIGLYEGQLWLDGETSLPLREFGRLVKSPSIFLKQVEFVREYTIRDGIAVPAILRSSIETRIVGTAHLSVSYVEPPPEAAAPLS